MTPPRAAVVAAVVLVVVPATTGVAGPDATPLPGTASFAADAFAEDRGDVARVGARLSGTDVATVAIRAANRSAGYRVTLRVRDADGDGRVALLVNTYLVGRQRADGYAAAGDDEATLVAAAGASAENGTEAVLPAGRYALAVAAGTDAPALGNGSGNASGEGESAPEVPPDDRATLRLTEAGTDHLRVWAAPPGAATNVTTAAGIRRAMASGTLHRARYVRRESLVVVELGVSGLSGAFAAQPGADATARFGPALDAVGGGIATLGPTEDYARLFGYRDGDWTVVDGVAVVPDPDDDTYYLTVDLAAIPTKKPGREWYLSNGTSVIVVYTTTDGSLLAMGDAHPEHPFGDQHQEPFGVSPRSAEVGMERRLPRHLLVVPRRGNATVVGETSVLPGRNLTVVVAAADGSFEARVPATVTFEDGDVTEGPGPTHRFVARVNLSSVPAGTELRVDVRFRGRSLLAADGGPVEGVVARDGATVTDVRRGEVRRSDLYARVRLVDDGFLVAHDGSADGPVLAVSPYLRGGTRSHVGGPVYPDVRLDVDGTVEGERVVLVVHRDANGNRTFDPGVDPPYRSNGTPVAVSVPWGGSPTPAATATPNGPSGPTGEPDATPTTGASGVAGFGFAAVLAALVAAVATLRRRR